jgi:histidyl-tRNA synthetase
LAYYTGVVFEVHALGSEFRAICGGGRYDNLLSDFGGPAISATGMGMGDCVLEILLREKGLIEQSLPKQELDYFVALVPTIAFDDEDGIVQSFPEDEVNKLVAKLQKERFSADSSYKSYSLGKQLKEASARNARKCVIIGEEFKDKKLTVKDMATGEQGLVDVDEFLSRLKSG